MHDGEGWHRGVCADNVHSQFAILCPRTPNPTFCAQTGVYVPLYILHSQMYTVHILHLLSTHSQPHVCVVGFQFCGRTPNMLFTVRCGQCTFGAPQSFERQVCNCACTYTKPKILCRVSFCNLVSTYSSPPCTPLYSLLANSSPLHSSVPSSAGALHKTSKLQAVGVGGCLCNVVES